MVKADAVSAIEVPFGACAPNILSRRHQQRLLSRMQIFVPAKISYSDIGGKSWVEPRAFVPYKKMG